MYDFKRRKEKGERRNVRSDNPDGALPLFIGGGDHVVVRGCRIRTARRYPDVFTTLILNLISSPPCDKHLSREFRTPHFGTIYSQSHVRGAT